MPKVSVVMAVHNGMPYLPEAVESILKQSLSDFEFLIVDDASEDETAAYLASLKDERIQILRNPSNQGLSRSLNAGLELASGDYVARMDHDDISLPPRLAAQAAFHDAHPDVDVVGTWARTRGMPREQSWRYPLRHEAIRAEMLFASALVHSSVMIRRASLEWHGLSYDPNIARAQDYELWVRAAGQLRYANLGKVLLTYRVHPAQVGRREAGEQQKVADGVRERQLHALGLSPDARELALHHALARWDFDGPASDLEAVEAWLLKLEQANLAKAEYVQEALRNALEGRWWAACRARVSQGLAAWRRYMVSPLSKGSSRGAWQKAQFYAKCLLREWGWRA